MIVEAEVEVSQQPVIRHYRGTTRAEVEQAYRSDAEQAAKAGYLPLTHQWTNDWQGLLLVVSYRGSSAPAAPQAPVMSQAPVCPGTVISQAPVAQAPVVSQAPVTPPAPIAAPAPVMEQLPVALQIPVAADQPPASGQQQAASEQAATPEPHAAPQAQVITHQPEASTPQTDQFASSQNTAYQDPYTRFAPSEPASPTASIDDQYAPSIERYSPPPINRYSHPTYSAPAIEQSAYEPAAPEQPTYEEPATEQPTYELLVTDRPAYDPLASEQPLHESLAPEPPTYYSPPIEQPTYSAAPIQQPTYEAPPVEQPTYSAAPTYEAPPVEQPWFHEPAPVAAAPAPLTAEPEPPQSVEYASAPPAAPVAEPETAPAKIERPAPVREPRAHAPIGRQARLTIQTMDLHCAGEPLRIIRSGFPEVPNLPVLERRKWVMEHADHVRRAIIQEPRGHRDMYGAILLPPHSDYADMTVLFMHNEGYSTMCGHGIIAITTGLIEEGLFPATEPVTTIRYEVPAGIVAANAATVQLDDGTWAVQGVRFTNVPSYVAAQSLAVRPDGVTLHGNAAQYGALSVDLAFGGAYYGIVNAAELGLRVVPDQAEELRHAGAAITEVLRRDHTPSHPTDAALSFVYGTIIVDLDPRSSPDGRATAPTCATPRSLPTPSSTDRHAARAPARSLPSCTLEAGSRWVRRSSTQGSPASISSAASKLRPRLARTRRSARASRARPT